MSDKKQPNILVIWGDDIGQSNLSCYSDGLMGYRTPNIDRIGEEGRGFEYILHGLNPERVLVASEAVGLGRVALERAALVERLDWRVEGMCRGGMLEEVARL